MGKVDTIVMKETKSLALVVLILSALLEAVYLIIGHWNYTVLLGNILGGGVGLLNFFLMGISLQKALSKQVSDAKATARLSQTYRNIMILAVLAIAYLAPCFDIIPTIISLFFATLGVYSKLFVAKKDTKKADGEVDKE